MMLRIVVAVSVITAGLMGCASSHTQPKHSTSSTKHSYSSSKHSSGKHYRSSSPKHKSNHKGTYHHSKTYKPVPHVPGRTQDGRYVLPGGLESVCAGGTPPPCK